MTQDEIFNELLDFFKALSDANRLRIIGILAGGEHSVGEVAELLNISISTASNHLSMLAHIGLAAVRPSGHYYYYSLREDTLREMTARLLKPENLPRLSQTVDQDAFDRKVLRAFLDDAGRITSFPAQEKKFIVLLKHVAEAFEVGKRYPEKEVNEILLRFNKDTATLRRGMIEFHLMEREGGGGTYWRV
jgi:predicted transcriptional regulator